MKKAIHRLLILTAFLYIVIAKQQCMGTNIQLLTAIHPETGELITEEFRPVNGYEGLYEVSDFGRVKSLDRYVVYPKGGIRIFYGRLLSLSKPKGYDRVTLIRNNKAITHFVHQLVAIAFISPRTKEKPWVNHKNFIRDDNRPENLEWVNSQENMDHQVNGGRSPKGSKNPSAILTEEQVREIKTCKMSFKEMSLKYGVCIGTLEALRYGRTWKHIES